MQSIINFFKSLNASKENYILISFLIFIGVMPFKLILAPISFALLIISYLLFGDKNTFKNLQKYKNVLLITILFLLNFVGVFLNYNSEASFNGVTKQLFLILVPILFVLLNLNSEQIKNAKHTYVVACVLFCVVSFLMLFYNFVVDYDRRLDYNFIQRSMYHFHFPYDTLTINIGYTILLFNVKSKFKLVISGLFFVFILLSGVRMGQFLFAVITLAYVALNIKSFLNIKSVLFLLLFLVLGVLLVKNSRYANDKFFDSLSKLGFGTEKYVSDIGEAYHNVSLREKLWETAIITFKKSPNKLLGYGPRGSKSILNNEYIELGHQDFGSKNSHNQYLTTLLDSGIVGLILLITILLIGLKSSIVAKSNENFIIVLVITIALITESILERQKGVSLFAIFLTLAFLENKIKTTTNKSQVGIESL